MEKLKKLVYNPRWQFAYEVSVKQRGLFPSQLPINAGKVRQN
jgi:hypothetical protein